MVNLRVVSSARIIDHHKHLARPASGVNQTSHCTHQQREVIQNDEAYREFHAALILLLSTCPIVQ
jgi:hypothetical protein